MTPIKCALRAGRHPHFAVDGDLNSGTVASVVNSMMIPGEVPPTVVVSIAYHPIGRRDWLLLRHMDLTPTRVRRHEKATAALVGESQCPQSGGASAFLEFIEKEVKSAIQEAHGVDSKEWTLSGSSLGGLFTLHALMSNPSSFRRYLSISPSVWWQRPLMFDRAREFVSKQDSLSAALFVTVGDGETPAYFREFLARRPEEVRKKIIEGIGENDMVGDAQEIAAILSRRSGLKVKSQVMENETHNSLYGVALSQGLRWLHRVTGSGDRIFSG